MKGRGIEKDRKRYAERERERERVFGRTNVIRLELGHKLRSPHPCYKLSIEREILQSTTSTVIFLT